MNAQTASFPGQTAPVSLEPQALIEANSLVRQGGRPFHLKVTFQVMDLKDNLAETGTLERWWAGPEGAYVEVTSPSLGIVHSLEGSGDMSLEARRSLFLATDLLRQYEQPAEFLGPPKTEIKTERREVSHVAMQCMHPAPSSSKELPESADVCVDLAAGTIRFVHNEQEQIVRNRVGHLGDTRVALDIELLFGGRKLITGHTDQLERIDPAKLSVTLEKPERREGSDAHGQVVPDKMLAGQKIAGSPPRYPAAAREQHIQGSVVLGGKIAKTGQIAWLVPLVSPDPILTEAAVDAIKTWTYRPYLLDGEPTDVNTTITVNFNLSR